MYAEPTKIERYATHMVEVFGVDKCLSMSTPTFVRYLTMLEIDAVNNINARTSAGAQEYRDAGRLAGRVRALIAGRDWYGEHDTP